MMNTETEKKLYAIVENLVDSLAYDYGLEYECNLDGDNLYVEVSYMHSWVSIFDNDIMTLDDMSEKEILNELKDEMVEAFDDFDINEELEKADNDIDIYEALKDDAKEYKRISWLIKKEKAGFDTSISSFESALVDELARIGKLMSEEIDPNFIQQYAVDIERLIHSNELYQYMQSKNIDTSNVSYYDVNFFHIMQTDGEISSLWVRGEKDKAVEKFQTHVF